MFLFFSKLASFCRSTPAAFFVLGGAILVGAACLTIALVNPELTSGASGSVFKTYPQIRMTAPPVLIENKILLMAYDAEDEIGIKEVALRIEPHDPRPGANNASVEVRFSVAPSKSISRTDSDDLTKYSWSGQRVSLQLVATNNAGRRSFTKPIDMVLPARRFVHPVAVVLLEERNKLLLNPDDELLRQEAANIMARIAHEPANFRGDPVVLMALRSGAVRLVLGHDREAAVSVSDLLWQAASRIEDGAKSSLLRTMSDTRQDIAAR